MSFSEKEKSQSVFEIVYAVVAILLAGYYIIYPHFQVKEYARENGMSYDGTVYSVCRDRVACPKLKEVREQCAIASDFEKCVSVKMDNDFSMYSCKTNGSSIRMEKINANLAFCEINELMWKFR